MSERTYTVTCPHCAADVVTKARDLRVHVDLAGAIVANVELLGTHRCAPRINVETATRCAHVNPETSRRCVLTAGHWEQHDDEFVYEC